MKRFNLKEMDTRTLANEGIDHQVVSPGGEQTNIFIRVIGRDAEEYQKAARRLGNKAVEQYARSRRFTANLEQQDREQLDLLVLATRGWYTLSDDGAKEPYIELGDEKLAWTPENARRLYTELPELRDQMQEVVNERANFLRR